MSFDLTGTMDGLATLARTGTLAPQVYAWPAETVTVPAIVVGYPERVEFDLAFARGADSAVIPVWYVVGKSSTKAARDVLSDVIADASSIKSAFDGNHAFGSVRVTEADITEIVIAGVPYLAAKFSCEVVG
jgi:hypothetical protein